MSTKQKKNELEQILNRRILYSKKSHEKSITISRIIENINQKSKL